jgi:hypothetical protein
MRAAAVPLVVAMAVTNDGSNQTVVDTGPAGGPRPGGPGRDGPRGPDRDGPRGADRDGPRGPGRDAPPPGAEARGPQAEVSGRVMAPLYGRRGEVNGAMLEDGTVLRMPPHQAERLKNSLAVGQTVVAQGTGLANGLGRVLEVRAIGASRDAMTTLQGPPPRGEGGRPPAR